uniref:TATA box-binding protein-like 1 n=1 Tax=Syphacia muris TaxID=451379 RepID=A0A0N5AUZ3_9BILA
MVETPETATTSSVNQESENEGEIDIQIRNVVCNFTLPLHIDLHRVALHSGNVTFDRGRGVILEKFISLGAAGNFFVTLTESECKRAARGVARMVQKRMGREADSVRIRNYKICNVLATCKMPFGIKIEDLAKKYPDQTQYEPELKVGLDWKCNDPKATLRIHTTGSITVLGAISENDVMRAIEIIYPIVREFRCVLRSRDYAGSRKRKQFLRSSSEEDLFFDVKRPPRPSKQVMFLMVHYAFTF